MEAVLDLVRRKVSLWNAQSARQQRETQRLSGQRRKSRSASARGSTLSPPSQPSSACRIPNNNCTTLLGFVTLLLVIWVCLQQLRNDVLIQDALIEYAGVPEHWLNTHYDEEQQVSALEAGRAILRGGRHEGGVLMDRPMIEHEIKALVDGEDAEDNTLDQHNNLREQDEAWNQVQRVFEKRDAQAQSVWWNAHKLVHVVHTRCLQNQPRLIDYTKARMDQFTAFTLPSMQHQTNDEFLWIIWTDPSLLPATEEKLKALVKSMPNVVVIGWKKSRPDIRSTWFQVVFDQSYMLHGSYKLIMSYHKAALSGHITLDTYLDSDDAVRSDFVQSLQDEAAVALAEPKAYRFWCPSYVLEWGFFMPDWQMQLLKEQKYHTQLAQEQEKQPKSWLESVGVGDNRLASQQYQPGSVPEHLMANISIKEKGFFMARHGTDKCLNSAASTVGVSGNATLLKDFPIFAAKDFWKNREEWHQTVMPCDHKGEANCLGFMVATEEDHDNVVRLRHDSGGNPNHPNQVQAKTVATASHFKAVLLQSKTITAAATKSIEQTFAKKPKPSAEVAFEVQELVWASLHTTFGVEQPQVENFCFEFQQNIDKILLDMLTICLPSNACNAANKKALNDLLTSVGLKREQQQHKPQVALLPAALNDGSYTRR